MAGTRLEGKQATRKQREGKGRGGERREGKGRKKKRKQNTVLAGSHVL